MSLEIIYAHGLKKIGIGVLEAEHVPNPLHLPDALNNITAISANLIFPILVMFGFLTRLSVLPILADNGSFISFGGETRFQYFYVHNEDWGDSPQDMDGYTLSRYLLHADFHAVKYFRAFFQLQSSMAGSRPNTSPVEENPLEAHQMFLDINPLVSENRKLALRIGRQELTYGSQRLVSVREAPNNRQSFDAARIIYSAKNSNAEVFYGHYVQARKGIFDDKLLSGKTKLWGAYLTFNDIPIIKNIDLYYFGLDKRIVKYIDVTGKELRHSFGTRIFDTAHDWKYDVEGLYQMGEAGGRDIAAWTASVNTSYQFSTVVLKPQIGLKADLISGDLHSGGDIETFNPLFPKGVYFGLAALIGPSNLMDIHPSVSLALTPEVSFEADYDVFWRFSAEDGLYESNMTVIYPAGDSREKYIGGQLTGALYYKPFKMVSFRGELTWFQAGSFLKDAGTGKDILFAGTTAEFKF